MNINKIENLTLEVGDNCPLKCKHCSSMSGPSRNQYADIDIVEDFFKTLPSKIENLEISGGEPFQHPDLIDLIKRLTDYSKDIDLYTSGTKIDDEITHLSKEELKRIKRLNVDNLVFSLHDIDPDKHDKFTQIQGSFELNKKSRKIAKKLGFEIGVHIVPTTSNFNNLDDMTRKLLGNDIDNISFLRLVEQGRAAKRYKKLRPDNNDMADLLKRLKNKYDDHIDIGAHYQSICPVDRQCRAGNTKFAITPDHYLFPCTSLKNHLTRDDSNSISSNSFEEIIVDSKAFEEFYELKNNFEKGCPAQNLNRGNYDG